jgi:Holliday junction resolvase RusA-like endonuclease
MKSYTGRTVAKILTFVLPGVPVPKGRPRMTKRGHVFTPKKTVSYERSIALAAQAAKSKLAGGQLFDGPVMVTIHCHFGMPKSWSRKRKEAMLYEPHIQLPDLDNLVKSVLDGLNQTFGIWDDDKQVAAVTATKHWSEESSVLVRIEKVNDGSHNDWNGNETKPERINPPTSEAGTD